MSIWPDASLPRTEGTKKLKRRLIQQWAAGESAGRPATVPSETTVESVVSRFASGRALTAATTLDELGLSSLDRVEMMMALEEAFQVTLDEGMLAQAKTIGDLQMLVAGGSGVPRFRGAGLPDSGVRPTSPTEPIAFPSWNRSPLAWFLRRISLPTWILPLARVFLELEVKGLEHLAAVTEPVIFAANHQSHMDAPAIFLALPPRWRYRVAPAMAKEFFKPHFNPQSYTRKAWFTNSLNYYLSCMFFNAFPLPQREAGTRQTLRYIGEVTADGYSVLIFPEGKRTEHGEIVPFRPGVGMIGARLGVPVVPVRLEGLEKVLHQKMKWPIRGPVRVTFGRPMRLQGEDYEALAKQVEDAVRALGA
jgi:long-chain acyl-CoA synthetase